MEYERIHKVQTCIISPSKLRMKLMGPHHHRNKDGSNGKSSRTSPSKLEDTEFFKDSLFASNSGDFREEVRKEIVDNGCVKMQPFSKCEKGNSSAVHPVRTVEDENVDYASNAISSSFEFHNERFDKWIMKRQNVQPKYFKKNNVQNQTNRAPVTSRERVAPELLNHDPKSSNGRVAETKLVDFCQPASHMAFKNSLSLLLDLSSFLVQHMGQFSNPRGGRTYMHTKDLLTAFGRSITGGQTTRGSGNQLLRARLVKWIISCSCHKISLHEEYENRNDPCYKSSLLGLLHLMVQQLLSAAQLPQSHLLPKDVHQHPHTSSLEITEMEELGQIEFVKRAAAWDIFS
ncbi:hypothetical protein POTOM_039715 [Populus tomentosa]|uniref:Uncharacterized protein n=1 Tax=Populus tomentosa TaxID=118781 RepID=A0A8X8CJ78_POPTO|nr:hypothetical protein POTOM_039715 [Populus tomentosa]